MAATSKNMALFISFSLPPPLPLLPHCFIYEENFMAELLPRLFDVYLMFI